MSLCLTPRIEALAREISGRTRSRFETDCARRKTVLERHVEGRRILVVGGAGSIGSATLMELLDRNPAAVTVLDTNENNLAELVRTVRSRAGGYRGEFSVEPLDYGSPLVKRYLDTHDRFDMVFSFAALKHVRSERDVYSLLRMFEVNLLKADRFLSAVRQGSHGSEGVFFVSTDKAARPCSLMGASKRLMEMLLWAHATSGAPASLLDGHHAPELRRVTTTRFANVAYSDGSLPWGFFQRLEKRQPLAAPKDVRRYLISPVEAGQLCLLAAFVCPHRHVMIPRMDPARDTVDFIQVAVATLKAFGYEARFFENEADARGAVEQLLPNRAYPVLVTPSDTSGEKELEEFVADGEEALDIGLDAVQAVDANLPDVSRLGDLLRWIDGLCMGGCALPSKDEFTNAVGDLVPDFAHAERGLSLDRRM